MSLKSKLVIGGSLAVAFAGVAAVGGKYAYNQMFDYSSGTRNVYNIKFSEKGSLCKTWEGEGTMLTPAEIGGQGMTSTFKFSVSDGEKKIIEDMIEAGKNPTRMYTLNYRQVKWFISCQHDSEYMIEGITAGEEANPYIIGGGYNNGQATPPRPRR